MYSRVPTGLLIVFLLLGTSLSGCFGAKDMRMKSVESILQIDFEDPQEIVLKTGEWHQFAMEGNGYTLEVPDDVLIFVNDTIIPDGMITVTDEKISGLLLLTPYVTEVNLTLSSPEGLSETIYMEVANGTPIVSGEEWFQKMDFITSVCADSTQCGGYINRWMGSGNPQFERAAVYFQGHFEGLGYETHLMRVFDHGNPTQPESLNVIAWKQGRNNSCVQGMGAHMDVAPPGSLAGTYEGAYDNTAGTVSMMLFARAFVDLEFECDTFLALWSSEEEGLRGSNAFANNECDYCLPKDKELKFYINMDMMGISWPAHKSNGDPFPYHAWTGPDFDPDVQDVEITTVVDDVHFKILKAPRNLTIDGSYGSGCDQHWDEHHNLVMDVHEDTFGRSDHVTFRNLGAQTIFHLGAYDDDYDAYHSPTDTLDNMVTEVGGQEELEKSIQFVLWAAMLEFMIADQTPEIRNVNI
ncbi:MAG TPA: M28 family peptidase [Candidatus Poseidoniales archaeon]|nr:MAG TPA: M28 family peptidase [Candidatus Poseidoniales archaeon]HIH81271.1 Zn-dependent exopeptidase M28 [Candidatus Thalassarchaeaceae archaeon]|tara:strand:+ start:1452 stop:2852 length:1401 start_codon:yes stop_codon:yes gene_type:complete